MSSARGLTFPKSRVTRTGDGRELPGWEEGEDEGEWLVAGRPFAAAESKLACRAYRIVSSIFFRPFSVQKIPHSNLMLLVVDTLCPCGSKQLNISPREVVDAKECDLKYEFMYRRRTGKCVNYHPEVTRRRLLPISADDRNLLI